MDLRRLVAFDRPIDATLHELLTTAGAWPSSGDPSAWMTPSPEAFAAITTKLTGAGAEFEVFFEFEPSQGESLQDVAAFVGLTDFAELEATPRDLVMACDERTLATVVSEGMRALLEGMTSKLTMDPLIGHDGFFVITGAAELPDPIVVPRAMWLSEGTTGSWAVQSDGRELLTAGNLRLIQESGLAHTPFCSTGGRVLPWRRPPIVSGPVLAELRDRQVLGIVDPPAFLGHASES